MKEFKGEVFFKNSIISSSNVGIISGYFKKTTSEQNMPSFSLLTADIPKYSRAIFHSEHEVQFHIAGYDIKFEEAFKRMNGEVVERYASLIAHSLVDENDFIFASFSEMNDYGKKALDPKYLDVFSSRQLLEASKNIPEFSQKSFSKKDKIWWTKIKSIFNNDNVWIPSQLFFVGFPSTIKGEKIYLPSVTTGTAAHVNYEKAIFNSLVEIIQINNFNQNWYYSIKGKELTIDDIKIKNWFKKILKNNENIELKFHLYNDFETKLFSVGCFILTKDKSFPAISFGVQSAISIEDAVKRSALEALAIYFANYYNYIFDKGKNKDSNFYADLDKNVLFFANPNNFYQNINVIKEKVEGNILYSELSEKKFYKCEKEAVSLILKEFKNKGYQFFYMDITPPEVKNIYIVTRLWSPDFLPVFLPSLYYQKHPSIKTPVNEYIHPLA